MERGAEGGWTIEEGMWDMRLCWCFSVLNPHGVLNSEVYSVQLTLFTSSVVQINKQS